MEHNQSSCKIYSRNRLKIFKKRKNNNDFKKRNYKTTFILGILFIAISTYFIIYKSINPIFDTICADEAKSIATKITNEESSKAMDGYTYNDLFKIEKDENGNIQMINANIFIIDKITSNVASYIQNSLNNTNNAVIKIPLGGFFGIKMFSGVGPQFKIKISSSGNVSTDLKSEFESRGINQTIHRIYLQIDCKVNILTPIKSLEENISNQILLAENVIIGQIPATYYNFEGLDGKDTLDALN